MKDEFIVKGAMATCQFGVAPAMLSNIMDNMNVYFNGKLAATSMSLGPVFQAPAFGTCNMVPNMPKPCAAVITKWDNVFMGGMKINRISSPLTKDSKGTCALGCPMCISFTTTGQLPIPAVPLPEIVKVEHQSDMNPLAGNDVSLKEHALPINNNNSLQEAGYDEHKLREEYTERAKAIKDEGLQRIKDGEDEEKVARWANDERNKLKVEYLMKTPEDLRNLIFKYNRKRGRTTKWGTLKYEELKAKGKTDLQIIESAARPQPSAKDVAENIYKELGEESLIVLNKYKMLS